MFSGLLRKRGEEKGLRDKINKVAEVTSIEIFELLWGAMFLDTKLMNSLYLK
jgi:hypothetical protein